MDDQSSGTGASLACSTDDPNTIAGSTCFSLADGVMCVIALLPPSSNRTFSKRPATSISDSATHSGWSLQQTPMLFFLSRHIHFPYIRSTSDHSTQCGWILVFLKYLCHIFWQATAQREFSQILFQMTALPHIRAGAAFHDHTAAGNWKPEITPTIPRGCHCSYIRCMGLSECMLRPWVVWTGLRQSRRCRSSPALLRVPPANFFPSHNSPVDQGLLSCVSVHHRSAWRHLLVLVPEHCAKRSLSMFSRSNQIFITCFYLWQKLSLSACHLPGDTDCIKSFPSIAWIPPSSRIFASIRVC